MVTIILFAIFCAILGLRVFKMWEASVAGFIAGVAVGLMVSVQLGGGEQRVWINPQKIELTGLVPSDGSPPLYLVLSDDRKYWMAIGKSTDGKHYTDRLIRIGVDETEFKETARDAFLISYRPRIVGASYWLFLAPNIWRYEIYLPEGGMSDTVTRRAPRG